MVRQGLFALLVVFLSGEPELNDLSGDARELKEAFNEAKGSPRVLMIVSPG